MKPEAVALAQKQLARDEGDRLRPYLDTAVPPRITIGRGRNLSDVGISVDELELMFANDLSRAAHTCLVLFSTFDDLDAVRQATLANIALNLGTAGLAQFHGLRKCVEAGDFDGAADAMKDSHWAQQVGARADRLEAQMRTGVEV